MNNLPVLPFIPANPPRKNETPAPLTCPVIGQETEVTLECVCVNRVCESVCTSCTYAPPVVLIWWYDMKKSDYWYHCGKSSCFPLQVHFLGGHGRRMMTVDLSPFPPPTIFSPFSSESPHHLILPTSIIVSLSLRSQSFFKLILCLQCYYQVHSHSSDHKSKNYGKKKTNIIVNKDPPWQFLFALFFISSWIFN